MILILAEKPSLARNIAAGIGQMQRRDGYMEGMGYLISWTFGHLFSLCDIEAYSPESSAERWSMEGLPCFPETFRFELRRRDSRSGDVDEGIAKQFAIIKQLCNRPDVDTIVNAGDADREGEIIVRICLEEALESEKPIKRLWLPDQTPQTVRAALADMKDDSEYDHLANEGFARTYIDWLYGVNLTRYATLRSGTLLRVGRVIVPIVQAIYQRDMAIRHFVPGHYLALVSKEETSGELVELTSKVRFEEKETEAAKTLARRYNSLGAVVTAVKKKKETLPSGKFYSLSKLQNVLGKKYKMSMQDSLAVIQRLYERGFLTYPRTNSEYLASAEKDKVKEILAGIKKLGYPVAFRDDKHIFDDSKIESHSALTPTYKIPDKGALSEEEQAVYSTVFRRFVAVFCEEKCVVSKTEITVAVGEEETFTLKGTVMLEPGWTKYDDRPAKDKILPKLEKGDAVNIAFAPTEKETSPPKHYTIETLNNYLKNPFKEDKKALKEASETEEPEDDTEDYRAIFEGLELGTEATRTGIITNARNSHYIDLKKDVYTILPDGEFLIETLERLNISMDKYKTSEMGRALKQVFRGQLTVEDSVRLAEKQVADMFRATDDTHDTGFFGDTVGDCPLCGRAVKRQKQFYGCSGYKENGCRFSIGTYICNRAIPKSAVELLLKEGHSPEIDGFISPKTGKTFRAALRLDESGKAVFHFPEKQAAPKIPPCPLCGGQIVKGRTAYGCSLWKEGCTFRLPFAFDGTEIGDEEALSLLSGKTIRLPTGNALSLDGGSLLCRSE